MILSHSLMIPPPPTSTLFPYTTLFRSHGVEHDVDRVVAVAEGHRRVDDRGEVGGVGAEHERGRHTGVDDRRRARRSEEHTSELQSRPHLVCRLLLEKKKQSPVRTTDLE